MDLTSLVLLAGLFLGLTVGNAALFGDPVQVQISVPSKVSDKGFTEAAAERVFAVQVADLGQAQSIVETPQVQMSTRPTIVAAMAKPLQLADLVAAVQSKVGVDVVTVHGIVLTDPSGAKLDMITVVNMPREIPAQFTVTQADGDANALVQHAAEQALEYVSPYRMALTLLTRGIEGDPAQLVRAKDIATRAIARPWSPGRATEHVMLHNLLAMVAMLDGDQAEAEAQFRLTDKLPAADPAAHGVVELGRCFIDIAAKRPAEAEVHYRAGTALTAGVKLPDWPARMKVLGALTAWSRGDVALAESMLRRATAEMPEGQEGHTYLAQLLDAKGDAAGAAAERETAGVTRRFGGDFQTLPQALFWVDPAQGGMRRRT